MAFFRQVRLKEVNGDRETVAWIETRGAKEGAHVELKDFDSVFFKVIEVYEPALEATALREKQAADRNCFGSIIGNRSDASISKS